MSDNKNITELVTRDPHKAAHCSFCSKPAAKVQKLVAGSIGYICNDCVLLCYGIMLNENVPGYPYKDQ